MGKAIEAHVRDHIVYFLRNTDLSLADIAKGHDVSVSTVRRIKKNSEIERPDPEERQNYRKAIIAMEEPKKDAPKRVLGILSPKEAANSRGSSG